MAVGEVIMRDCCRNKVEALYISCDCKPAGLRGVRIRFSGKASLRSVPRFSIQCRPRDFVLKHFIFHCHQRTLVATRTLTNTSTQAFHSQALSSIENPHFSGTLHETTLHTTKTSWLPQPPLPASKCHRRRTSSRLLSASAVNVRTCCIQKKTRNPTS